MVQPSEQGAKGKVSKTAKKGARTRQGKSAAEALGVDRMVLIEKAWGYKVKGYSAREIGDAIADEFNIEGTVHHKTIFAWLDEGRALVTRKIGLHREEHIETMLPRTEQQLRHWLPIANGQKQFAVARMEKVNGEMIEVIDEAVFKEQTAAANIVLKTLEQQRKVLGIGLANSGADDNDGKQASLTQINILLQQTINNAGAAPGAQIGQTPLTLEAGAEEFEQL